MLDNANPQLTGAKVSKIPVISVVEHWEIFFSLLSLLLPQTSRSSIVVAKVRRSERIVKFDRNNV